LILLVAHYQDPSPARAAELAACLRRNCENEQLVEVRLLLEDAAPPPFAHPKLRPIAHGRRATYRDLFEHAGQHLAGSRVIVANADIYFDGSLSLLAQRDLSGQLLCLSRWDVQPDGSSRLFDFASSQDAWIFAAPLPAFACDWHLGKPGCENRLAFEAGRAGLALSNPSRSVRAHHLHLSRVINYQPADRVQGPGRSLEPGFLEEDGAAALPRAAAAGGAPLCALTSLAPGPARLERQRACIASWRAAGLRVLSFNHPGEIESLRHTFDVEFVPVSDTTEAVFGRPYVPIHAFARWAAERQEQVLLLNADLELKLSRWELRRLRWLAEDGLCYFIRYNQRHLGDAGAREPWGIDAFLFHGAEAAQLPASLLSMGKPFWDYWLPHAFAARGLPVRAVEFPAAFHLDHPQRWSWEEWHRCALEFDRLYPVLGADRSFEACARMSPRVRQQFEQGKVALPQQPLAIGPWVRQTFSGPGSKTFLELGAHQGSDTIWMAALPGVTLHAFEPDPRNQVPLLPNVRLNRAAVSDRDGRGALLQSREGWGREWTYSSSLRPPKNHLTRYPVTFGERVEVETITLDSYCRRQGLGPIDFIWADVQGAEGEVVRGGLETLARTHYLYTEYSDDEMYQGQATLAELLALLPGFRVVELWEDDVLLENRRW
jgi:FkbM family methyltransferase